MVTGEPKLKWSHKNAVLLLGIALTTIALFVNINRSLALGVAVGGSVCESSPDHIRNVGVGVGSNVATPTNHTSKRRVCIFACDERYGNAVASSVVSLWLDGGYHGDVAIIMRTSSSNSNDNFTRSWMLEEIQHELKKRDVTELSSNITIYLQDSLLDELHLDDTRQYLREAPPEISCVPPKRKFGRQGYYLKSFLFHPTIAERWDVVLYMDACMTIHAPMIPDIFNMPEIENRILALPDPWKWGQHMMEGRLLPCANESTVVELSKLIRVDLGKAPYFTTAFLVFDTSVIRNYGTKASMIELLELYHRFGTIFPGDQVIMSIYWYHLRNVMQNLPLSMLGTNMVPYEWLPRVKAPHIVTAGNKDRETCLARPKNQFGEHKRNNLAGDGRR